MQEAQIAGDRLIQPPERIRHVDLEQTAKTAGGELPVTGGGPVTAPIQSQHGARVERGSQECARLMREMMFDEMPLPVTGMFCASIAAAQVMRCPVDELAFCIVHIRECQWLPR